LLGSNGAEGLMDLRWEVGLLALMAVLFIALARWSLAGWHGRPGSKADSR
jgi:hypothetical protein